jgi:hypothetical protein
MASEIIRRASELGLVSCRDHFSDEQERLIGTLIDMMENADSSDLVPEWEVESMHDEISELNDMLDLEECDRVEAGKSFLREGRELRIPGSLVPFVGGVLLPMLRDVVEKGP